MRLILVDEAQLLALQNELELMRRMFDDLREHYKTENEGIDIEYAKGGIVPKKGVIITGCAMQGSPEFENAVVRAVERAQRQGRV